MNHEPITRVDIIRRLALILAMGMASQLFEKLFGFWSH